MRSPRETPTSASRQHMSFSNVMSGGSGGEEEAKDLPPEEFKDFLTLYDQDLHETGEKKYLPLDQALKLNLDMNGVTTLP